MRKQPCHPVGLTLIPIWVSCSGEGGLSKSDDDYKGGKARLVVSQHLGGGGAKSAEESNVREH